MVAGLCRVRRPAPFSQGSFSLWRALAGAMLIGDKV